MVIVNEKPKVYCSYGHTGESNWILPLGFDSTHNIEKADVVVFGGGKDVNPGFYGEKKGSQTDSPSERDYKEREDFIRVQALRREGKKVKTVGICRGGQLLCALSGGKLIQDVGNHCGQHAISTFDRKDLKVNSIHHQMFFPYNMDKKDYKILAWSTKNLSPRYKNGWDKDKWLPNNFKELEVVYFKNTDALAIQSHPEMMFRTSQFNETMAWMQDLFQKFYEDQL